MNTKRKGARAERRAIALLEAAGFVCTKAGGSLGVFDVIAISAQTVRCLQVKSGGAYCSAIERERLHLLAVPANVSKEIWRFPDRCKNPLIERLAPGACAHGDPPHVIPCHTTAGSYDTPGAPVSVSPDRTVERHRDPPS